LEPARQAGVSLIGLVTELHLFQGDSRDLLCLADCKLSVDRHVTWVSDIRQMLDKDLEVVVFVAPLKRPTVKDKVTDSTAWSLGVLLRNVTWAMQAGKDVYVSSTERDAAKWGDPLNFHAPPPEMKAFLKNPLNELRETPQDAALKYRKVTSYGGIHWQDFAEFLKCVRDRSEPKHSFRNLPQAQN
jgi:hypothetical protein